MSGTKDTNYRSFGNELNLTVSVDDWTPPTDPLTFDDILKFSNCANVTAAGLYVPGGREDCSDAVQGKNYTWLSCVFEPKGKGGITIKGAIDGWDVDTCMFQTHGSKYDIEVGQFDNYWFPGRKPTRNGLIRNVQAKDGRPVRVFVWDGQRPKIENSLVVVYKIPFVIWFPYFCLRYFQVRRAGIVN